MMERQISNDSAAEVLIPRKHEPSTDNIPLVYGEEESTPIIMNPHQPTKVITDHNINSNTNINNTDTINKTDDNNEEQKGYENMDMNESNEEADESQGFLAHKLSDAIRNDESEEQELGQNLVTLNICEGEAQAMIYQAKKFCETTTNNHSTNDSSNNNNNGSNNDKSKTTTPLRRKFSPVKTVVNNTVQALTMNAKKYLHLSKSSVNSNNNNTSTTSKLNLTSILYTNLIKFADLLTNRHTLFVISTLVLSSIILEGIFCFLECKYQYVRSYVLSFFYFVFGVVTILLYSIQYRYPNINYYVKYLNTLEEKTYWFIILGVLSLGEEWWSLFVASCLFLSAMIHGFASFYESYKQKLIQTTADTKHHSMLNDSETANHLRIPGTPRHTTTANTTAAVNANHIGRSFVRSPQLGSPVTLGHTTTHDLL